MHQAVPENACELKEVRMEYWMRALLISSRFFIPPDVFPTIAAIYLPTDALMGLLSSTVSQSKIFLYIPHSAIDTSA